MPLLLFLLAFCIYWFAGNPVFDNFDTPWHLAAGEWIVNHGHIPATDPWSYASNGAPWLNTSWLWDSIISLIFSHFGALGLYAFTCIMGAGIIAALAYSLQQRPGLRPIYIVIAVLVALLSQRIVQFAQPQLATFLFIILFHQLLHHYPRDGRLDGKRSVAMLLIMLLWANMHSGFVAAFILLGAYSAEALWMRNWPWFVRLCTLTLACAVTCLINPYSYHIADAVTRFHSVITPYLADWQPADLSHPAVYIPLLLFAISFRPQSQAIGLAEKLLALAWLIAGLTSMRNFHLFVLLSAPIMAFGLQERLAATSQPSPLPLKYYTAGLAVFAVLLVAITLKTGWLEREKLNVDPYGLKPLVSLVEKQYPHTRFYTHYDLGGNLIFLSGGTFPIFADGRAGTAYNEEVLSDAVDFERSSDKAKQLIDKYAMRGAVLLNISPRTPEFSVSPEWKRIYSNEKITAFVKR